MFGGRAEIRGWRKSACGLAPGASVTGLREMSYMWRRSRESRLGSSQAGALVCAIMVFVCLAGGSASAGGYAAWVGGGANGTSPHGGYSDSTSKCKVCHAVHNASTGAGQQALLRSARGDDASCIYCHINPGSVSSLRPYGWGAGSLANYIRNPGDPDVDWAHDSWHGDTAPYSGCPSCHATHGMNTIPGEKDLKDNPGRAIAAPVTNRVDFCQDCHNKAGGNLLAGGCMSGCHGGTPYQPANITPYYFTTARDGQTHVMTTTLTGPAPGNVEVAWRTSETCESCHAAGQPYAAGNSYPHYTPNAVQFLDYGYVTSDVGLDRVCLNCHVEGGDGGSYATGVGKTY